MKMNANFTEKQIQREEKKMKENRFNITYNSKNVNENNIFFNIRLEKIKNCDNTQCWQGYDRSIGPFMQYWWEGTLVKPCKGQFGRTY